MLRSAPMAVLSSHVPSLCGRVAQSQVFLARRPRFDLNPEPDYCYHCEGRHSFQRDRVSSQALVPLKTNGFWLNRSRAQFTSPRWGEVDLRSG